MHEQLSFDDGIPYGYCQCGCGRKTNRNPRGPNKGKPFDYLVGHGRATKPDFAVDPETGCWVCQKTLRMGYGRIWRDGRLRTAHVWYWEQVNGPVPKGLDLDHMCHNNDPDCRGGPTCPHRACMNPDHLVLATRQENISRGRLGRLTRIEVIEIKAQPHVARRMLAERYGVTIHQIAAIRRGHSWKDI